MDFSTKQEQSYQPLNINGTPVERVDSLRYLGVYITQDLSWSCHINTRVKKARQHLYYLRRLRDFKLPSQVLKTIYTCTIESVLTGRITSWFGNSTMQDRRAFQRVVQSAEHTIHTRLSDLQDIYSMRCQTRARKIVKDLSHPNNRLFFYLLCSEKRFRALKANTERMRKSFFPQAIQCLYVCVCDKLKLEFLLICVRLLLRLLLRLHNHNMPTRLFVIAGFAPGE